MQLLIKSQKYINQHSKAWFVKLKQPLLFFVMVLYGCTWNVTGEASKDISTRIVDREDWGLVVRSADHQTPKFLPGSENTEENGEMYNHLTTDHAIGDIVDHPAFDGFGALLLPRDHNSVYYDTQLRNVGSLMPYHSHVNPDIVVGALNHMIDEVNHGKTIYYDFWHNNHID